MTIRRKKKEFVEFFGLQDGATEIYFAQTAIEGSVYI
jgi:hypothetical protein